MGADIHTFVEIKSKTSGDWVLVDKDIFQDRNYALFSFLAGVRHQCAEDPITDPRGLPKDKSNAFKWVDFLEGLHTFSYFTLEEMLAWDLEKHPNYYCFIKFEKEVIGGLKKKCDSFGYEYHEVRFVFGFDS
jgi:hypothetical protein